MDITVDAVVFGYHEGEVKLLLIKRAHQPYKGSWALPGGYVVDEKDDSLEAAVSRELSEETGANVGVDYMEQLGTYGDRYRDPRNRTITVAYYCLVSPEKLNLFKTSYEATEIRWFNINRLPDLAFDHSKIINDAIFRLKGKIRYQPVGLELLPEVFPFKEVQTLYESILNVEFNRGNFRTKFMKLGVIEETNEIEEGVPHRPAKMFRFNKSKYWQKQKDGMYFEI